MSLPTLASLTSLLALLPERENPQSVKATLRDFLVDATALIGDFTGMTFTEGEQEHLFDTYKGYTPTAFVPSGGEFSRREYMTVDLPVRGALPGLRVAYKREQRGDWLGAEQLVQGQDYIYDPVYGRIRFLRPFADRMEGLRVQYSTTGTPQRDILIGEELNDAISRTAVDSSLREIGGTFQGMQTKARNLCAYGPAPATIDLRPPERYALAHVELYAPRDVGMAEGPATVTMGLKGAALPPISVVHVPTPLPRSFYPMKADQQADGQDVHRIGIAAPGGEVYVSFVKLVFWHPTWTHLEGQVPPQVSRACAILAKVLYDKQMGDSVGRSDDLGGRAFRSAASIPSEVREMLRPFMQTGSGVTFI